jgi:hypothetical protein
VKRPAATPNPFFHLFDRLVNGYRNWGIARFVLLTSFGLITILMLALGLEYQALSKLSVGVQENLPFLRVIPSPVLSVFLTFFTWKTLRLYLIIPLCIFLSHYLGAKYLQDIYNLPSAKLPYQYLFTTMFGFRYPTHHIGQITLTEKKPKANYIPELGGPGNLDIQAGYIVLVSQPRAPSNIFTEGKHFLTRSEKVEDTINLNDQQDTIETLSAYTHDGIAILVSDIHFGYRLRAKQSQSPRGSESQPYAFSLEAMRNLSQSRVVTESGLTEWRTMVKGLIRSAIADFIYNHTATELLKPSEAHNPYTELKQTLRKRGFRERLRKMGTELLWINVGLFDFENPQFKQAVLQIHGAEWDDQADLERAEGEAQLVYYRELGRAEAQAELLQSILESIQSAPNHLDSAELIRSIIIARAAQVFDSFGKTNTA